MPKLKKHFIYKGFSEVLSRNKYLKNFFTSSDDFLVHRSLRGSLCKLPQTYPKMLKIAQSFTLPKFSEGTLTQTVRETLSFSQSGTSHKNQFLDQVSGGISIKIASQLHNLFNNRREVNGPRNMLN